MTDFSRNKNESSGILLYFVACFFFVFAFHHNASARINITTTNDIRIVQLAPDSLLLHSTVQIPEFQIFRNSQIEHQCGLKYAIADTENRTSEKYRLLSGSFLNRKILPFIPLLFRPSHPEDRPDLG